MHSDEASPHHCAHEAESSGMSRTFERQGFYRSLAARELGEAWCETTVPARCQEIPQPAESFSCHRRIKLIEEDERDLLRKIERQRLDRSGPAKLAECLCHHLDPE